MKCKIGILGLFLLLSTGNLFSQDTDDLNLGQMMKPADETFFVRDSRYYNWCNSIIKGDDGKYHLFYARWPKSIGFHSWLTHSEIAHAVADAPQGPYREGQTVLKSRSGEWDAVTAHNVKVEHFNRQYYLYYTSTNTGKEQFSPEMLEEVGRTGYSHKYWMLLRNNQRTGVAVSRSLDGKWKQRKTPMIEPELPIATVTVNPAIVQGPDRLFYLMIKGDKTYGNKKGVIQAIAHSKKPDGPFHYFEKPAFDEIPTEDASIWYDQKRERFYGIFHAHGGNFLGLITSVDGKNWTKAKHYQVCKKEIPLKDGTVMRVERMERPFVYIENGEPRLLCAAVKKGNDAFIVFFPLDAQ